MRALGMGSGGLGRADVHGRESWCSVIRGMTVGCMGAQMVEEVCAAEGLALTEKT